MKLALTGSSGFIGWHLRVRLLRESDITIVPIGREEFADAAKLQRILFTADAVVHLAGGRFSQNDEEDYTANMGLTNALFAALRTNAKSLPLLFMSSRSATEKQNGYGRAKRDGSAFAKAWGEETGAPVCVLIPPNVIGEFAQPDHHTAIATFCRDIAAGKESIVNAEGSVDLVHAQDVADEIIAFLRKPESGERLMTGTKFNVKEIYDLLSGFWDSYKRDVFPVLPTLIEKRLFSMLYSYGFESLIPRPLSPKQDERGTLVEVARALSSGQSFISTTVPGAIRGEHYHVRKIERFCVTKGEATIRLRKLFDDKVLEYKVSGDTPVYIDMPTFYTHHIENTGAGELTTFFWTNELYDSADPDTYPEKVR